MQNVSVNVILKLKKDQLRHKGHFIISINCDIKVILLIKDIIILMVIYIEIFIY